MTNENLPETGGARKANGRHVEKTRKESNWPRSIMASAALVAVGSLGTAVVLDWYFYFLVDGLATSLRPIGEALHQAIGHGSNSKTPAN